MLLLLFSEQVQGFEEAWSQHGATRKYTGFLHCVRTIAAEEGVRGFYRGLSPSLVKAVVSTALGFAAYEQTLSIMRAAYFS